ncbi:MAG: glutathione peroxidase [Bacteroidales bacterium]|nr:glutathione peroxidase [Bacteroidales bacterium]
MKRMMFCLMALVMAVGATAQPSIYSFSFNDAEGTEVSMKTYTGKVLLIVNTATECGFTPQYEALQSIYEKYHDKGLELLDFPCNQFGKQAPGTNEEIHSFCVSNYHVEFPQMDKVDVNGANALPLFVHLKKMRPFQGFGKGAKAKAMHLMMKKQDADYENNPDIKWNFTKFLVDREGNVMFRFEPTASMEEVEEAVKSLL